MDFAEFFAGAGVTMFEHHRFDHGSEDSSRPAGERGVPMHPPVVDARQERVSPDRLRRALPLQAVCRPLLLLRPRGGRLMATGRDRKNPDDRGYRRRQARGRKNTKRWCRGKVGVEHALVFGYRSWTLSFNRAGQPPCRPPSDWMQNRRVDEWICLHVLKCDECGKILRHLNDDECPDRPVDE